MGNRSFAPCFYHIVLCTDKRILAISISPAANGRHFVCDAERSDYKKYVAGKSLYSGRLLKIPTPNFVVFYNGTNAQPESRILKLSDSFETKTDDPNLKLKVLQLNINTGKNQPLMERCRTLKEYSQYVACVRKHTKSEPIAEAVDHAVTECIQ